MDDIAKIAAGREAKLIELIEYAIEMLEEAEYVHAAACIERTLAAHIGESHD